MSLVIPDGFCSAAWIFNDGPVEELGTQPFIFTMGLEAQIGLSEQEVADACFDAWASSFSPESSDQIILDRVELTVPAVGGGTGVVTSTATALPGGRDLDDLYSVLAPKIEKRTALAGRKYKGRFHPPGLLEVGEVNADGSITSIRLGIIQGLAIDFVIALASDAGTPVILHSDPAIAPTAITAVNVAPKVGVLRNRMV